MPDNERVSKIGLGLLGFPTVSQAVSKIGLGALYKPVVTVSPSATIFISEGVTATADTREGETLHRTTDRQRRPAFVQNVIERGLAHGGCELNEELRLWLRRLPATMQLMGSTRGLELSVLRLTCGTRQVVWSSGRPGEWILDVTYPEVTPIWLDFPGTLLTIAVEFQTYKAPNFTAQRLADWIASHLAPRSVVEMVYEVAVATHLRATTAPHALGSLLTVEDSRDFPVGSTVVVRNGADTFRETRTVQLVPSDTQVVVDGLSRTYYTTDVLRRTLAVA